MRKRLLKSKKGEETTSAPSMTMIMLPLGGILLLVTMGFIWMLVSGTANDADDVTMISHYEMMGEVIGKMLENDALVSINEMPFRMSDGYSVVGFDRGAKEVEGAGNKRKRSYDFLHFEKPKVCGNNACLCLYKGTENPESVIIKEDKLVKKTSCFVYSGNIRFVSIAPEDNLLSVDYGVSTGATIFKTSGGYKVEKNGRYIPEKEIYPTDISNIAEKLNQLDKGWVFTRTVIQKGGDFDWDINYVYLEVWHSKDEKGKTVGDTIILISPKNEMTEKRLKIVKEDEFQCKISKGYERNDDCNKVTSGETLSRCAKCKCGPDQIKTYGKYCCSIGGAYIVTTLPCECIGTNFCSDYSTEKRCEEDACRVAKEKDEKCQWIDGKCYRSVSVRTENGNKNLLIED